MFPDLFQLLQGALLGGLFASWARTLESDASVAAERGKRWHAVQSCIVYHIYILSYIIYILYILWICILQFCFMLSCFEYTFNATRKPPGARNIQTLGALIYLGFQKKYESCSQHFWDPGATGVLHILLLLPVEALGIERYPKAIFAGMFGNEWWWIVHVEMMHIHVTIFWPTSMILYAHLYAPLAKKMMYMTRRATQRKFANLRDLGTHINCSWHSWPFERDEWSAHSACPACLWMNREEQHEMFALLKA